MAARKGTGPRKGTGKPKPASAGKGKPAKPRTPSSGAGKSTKGRNLGPSARGPRVVDARGAGRTGAVKPGPMKPGRAAGRGAGRGAASESDDDLGGRQIEGRQAVRELLIAGRRRVHEVWLAADLDESDVVEDIRDLARATYPGLA